MTEQFVVLLRGADRAEEFLPYIEAIARPGIKIVFLVHYGLGEFTELMSQVLSGGAAVSDGSLPVVRQGALEWRGPRVELMQAITGLRRRGVELNVSVYSGSARKAARQYVRNNDANVLMISRGQPCAIARWMRRTRWLAHLFKSSRSPAVMMVYR